MLPSTGLFKTIVCPYFETDGCSRPYCHFKHARKDEDAGANKPVTYIPSPTPAPQLLTLTEPVKKKTKLEYMPTKPTINDAPPKADYVSNSLSAPVYIPSNAATVKQEYADDGDADSEVIICDGESVPAKAVKPESPKAVVCSTVITLSDEDDDDHSPADENDEFGNTEEFSIPSEPVKTTNGEEKSEPKEKDKERRQSTSSRSHSSSHKSSHSSSRSSTKHKSSRDREKITSQSKDRDKGREKDGSSSKSKDHHASTSSSKSSSHRSHSKPSGSTSKTSSSKDEGSSGSHTKKPSSSSRKDSSSSRKGSSTSSTHRSSSKSKSSSSSSSHRKRSRSKERSSRSSDVRSAKEPKLDTNTLASYETTSDEEEEDIMAQCKALYEEFTSKTPQEQTSATPAQPAPAHKPMESTYEDSRERKKWLAHDKTGTAKPLIEPIARKTNHVQSAMQSIFKRQEMVKQQQEAAAAAAKAAEERKQAEEEKKRAEEEKKRAEAKAKEESTLTPLISRNYPIRPPVRIFAPASNVLAIQRAKKKVEELRAQKQMTPCKTVSKVVGRVAHNSTATEQSQPAPPVLEASSSKISYNLRMQYYNMMVKHCLNIYPTCEDAWDRAQTEELAVFKKCSTPVIYKSSALLAINKLRKESIDAGNLNTEKHRTVSHEVILAGKLAQTNAWSINKKKVEEISTSNEPVDKLPGTKVYELVAECCLTDEQLVANGYPRPGPKPGTAVIKETRSKPKPPNPNERYCGRCAKIFDMTIYDDPPNDECNYHPKSTGYRRGFADNMHRCCQQPAGTPGCTYADYHISEFIDYNNLTGFVKTIDCDKSVPTRKDIFALDCEMCYTTIGMELTRVTVVDMNNKTVYDALVQPDNKIIDYNTTYSGITEDMLRNEKRTLRDIQAVLLSMFHAKTILVGHSLESDLKALKLIHDVVVDTSVLYPHKMGPPYKRALKTLCIEYLKRIIQENEHGHDSAEDAEVCIQLVKYYLRNRIT